MLILGIETSCDDTGIAVLQVDEGKTPRFQIASNEIASQITIHQQYGGVYPMLAKREHEKNLPIVLKKALKEAGVEKTDVIALTYGPGLAPCLWAGVNFAKDLTKEWNVPLVPVDHIEGHLLVGLLENVQDTLRQNSGQAKYKIQDTGDIFPAIALIVSGGHTQLVLVKNIGDYRIIGETRDDAAGEAFDKTARILGLEFPGGPAIAREAKKAVSPLQSRLPRPMMHTKDYDFSFSGLKTAVLYAYQARPKKERESKKYVQAMAAEIQQAIVDVLIHKTMRAVKEYNAKSITLGGGVAANVELRRVFEAKLQTIGIRLLAPPKNLSTDNGVMIALAGYFTYKRSASWRTKNPDDITANPNLRIAQ